MVVRSPSVRGGRVPDKVDRAALLLRHRDPTTHLARAMAALAGAAASIERAFERRSLCLLGGGGSEPCWLGQPGANRWPGSLDPRGSARIRVPISMARS